MNLETGKTRISKKVLCVILSLVLAFGTFITFTGLYSPLSDLLGINNMLSAYAAEFVDTKGAAAVDEEAMKADDHTINLENKDGSNTVYLFSEPVSYKDEDGKIKTKDISVKKSDSKLKKEGYEYTNGANDYRINFSKNKDKGIQAEFDGASYSIIPQSVIDVEGSESVAENLDEKFEVFEYKNIYGNGTNLRFYPQLNGIKDEIVLNQSINQNTFSFELKTENCTASLNEDGSVSLVNNNGKTVQTFDAPFAYDSEYVEGDMNEHYIDCKYDLKDKDEKSYILTITVDDNWLKSEKTKYPVTIDPTTSHLSNAKDSGVYSKDKTKNWGSEQLCCFGRASEYGYGRVYSQFTLPSAIKKGATINSAYQWERECTGRTSSTKVIGYMVNASWAEGKITWENKPGYNSNYATNKRTISSKSEDNSSPYWYKFNIKSIVNQWINGGAANNGIVFRSDEEDNKEYNWRSFASRTYSTSSYKPYAVISYTNETTKPALTVTRTPETGWSHNPVKFTLAAKDNESGLASEPYSFTDKAGTYSWSKSNTKTFTKNQILYVGAKDVVGNVSSTSRSTYIDMMNPYVPTQVDSYDGKWTNKDVTLTINIKDRAATDTDGCAGIASYSISTTSKPSANASDWVSASNGAGNYTLKPISTSGKYYIFAKDRAGNISTQKNTQRDLQNKAITALSNDALVINVNIDKSAPIIDNYTINYNKEQKKNVLTVEARDVNEGSKYSSGIDGYSIDGGKTWQSSNEFAGISAGSQIDIAVKDKAGNINSSKTTDLEKPVIYQKDDTVVIRDYNHLGLNLEYDVNNSGNYIEYTEPIKIDKSKKTTITARFAGTDISNEITIAADTVQKASKPYTEETADIAITNNQAEFDIARYYDSNSGDWSFSTQSKVEVINENHTYFAILPDSQEVLFEDDGSGTLIDEKTEYTLAVDSGNNKYIIDCGDCVYNYSIDSGRLSCVEDKYNHGINFEYTDGKLTKIYTGEGADSRTYIVQENSNGKIDLVITPLNEKLVYQYDNDGLVKVYYDKNSLQYKRSDDIILNEYSYSNGRIETSNGSTVNYDENGNYVSITSPAGEVIENESETETEEPETETDETQDDSDDGTDENKDDGTEFNSDGSIKSRTETIDGKTYKTTYEYDSFGNTSSETVAEQKGEDLIPIQSTTYVYDLLNRCIKETSAVTDENKNVTTTVTVYVYDPVGNIIYQKSGNEVTRTLYDSYGRVIQQIEPKDYNAADDGLSIINENTITGNDCYSNQNIGQRYHYLENGNCDFEINRLNLKTDYTYYENSQTVKTEQFDIYRYEYNTDGNIEYIYVANTSPAYAHYVYDDNGNNTEIHYGNGQTVYYEYDSDKNIISQSYTDNSNDEKTEQFKYSYTSGELASKTDCVNHRRTDYSGNTVNVYDTSSETDKLLYSYSSTDDDTNTSATVTKSYVGNTLDITYGDRSNQYKLNNNDVFSVNTSYTDDKLSSSVINDSSNNPVVSKSYTYDNDNNITGLTVNNTQISYVYDGDKITEYHQGDNAVYYHYDSKDEITREDINYTGYQKTITYSYDSRGNLISKKEYAYTRETDPGTPLESDKLELTYDDKVWLDEINQTPTETILYDENGNPVNLEDCTLEWTNGRQLKAVKKGNEVILSYTYDDNGIRTSKTYQGLTTYYTTENGLITSQYELDENGNKVNEVIFIYDNGSLVSAYYNNKLYYYVTNAMGDVISIIDRNKNTVVNYGYDAWGNVVDKSVNSNLENTDFATANPMLYRSYYRDDELGVYYLQSRYYKSDWCRFINADLPSIAKLCKNEQNGLNLFAYCGNEPITNIDYFGFKYSPSKAKQYADKWWNKCNYSNYRQYESDCANFVSQCLYAGGISEKIYKGRKKWYYTPLLWEPFIVDIVLGQYFYDLKVAYAKYSKSWTLASELYNWLSKYHKKGNVIKCSSLKSVNNTAKKYYKKFKGNTAGKVAIFFDFNWKDENPKQRSFKHIAHATLMGDIVWNKEKKKYEIYYYSHTNSRNGKKKKYKLRKIRNNNYIKYKNNNFVYEEQYLDVSFSYKQFKRPIVYFIELK